MRTRIYNFGGKQLRVSPALTNSGELLRCLNFDNDLIGAKTKRPGYGTFLGTANGSAVLDLWSWTKEDGTSTFVYRNSGGKVYYYEAGIGTGTAWVQSGNGTVTAGNHMGHAVLADTMIMSQVGGTTRHTTDGTSFTDTTGAPKGQFLASYQNRIHIGSASTDFWSAAGSGTDWNTSGTSDSSSQTIPGPGKINGMFVSANRLNMPKSYGNVFRWDGYSLIQGPTDQGPSSPYSFAETEDYTFWLNRNGIFGYNGDRPEILSNAIEKEIRNKSGSAIAGTSFDAAPAGLHQFNYYLAVGTTTDDLTKETIGNAILKYDYQLNQFTDCKFAHFPTAWTTYKDNNGDIQFIFGDANGQCYKISGTAVSDAGEPIETVMEGVVNFGEPEQEKLFKSVWVTASPGCTAKVQMAISDTYNKNKTWVDVGQFVDGIIEYSFKGSQRGRFLFFRFYDYSATAPFTIYGITIEWERTGKQ